MVGNQDEDVATGGKSPGKVLPSPVGGSGIMKEDDGLGPANEDEDQPGLSGDCDVPGAQQRPMTEDEKLDRSLEDTFPTSDPIGPSRVDGPEN